MNSAKVRPPFTFVTLRPATFEMVAQVTLLWGLYERAQDDFLGLLSAHNATAVDWRRQNGPQRRKRLLKEASVALAHHTSILSFLTILMGDAGRLSRQRNVLVHGQITLAIVPQPSGDPKIILQATGADGQGQPIEIDFDDDALEDLAHDLGHLAGRAQQLIKPNEKPYDPLTSADKLTLRTFIQQHHPGTPMLSSPRARPV